MKVWRYVIGAVALTSVWMTYDNVLSDEGPLRDLGEQAACAKKKCSEKHGMTRMSRLPIGVYFEYEWRDGSVKVSCHREYYLVGSRQCVAD